jgi:hypothetical protein
LLTQSQHENREKLQESKISKAGSKSEDEIAVRKRKRDTLKRGLSKLFVSVRPYYDLADETRSFSGADIAGLVRSVSVHFIQLGAMEVLCNTISF